MRKLLLMMSCVAGVAFAAENMDMSNMDMSNMKGMESSCKTQKKMSSQCKAMMKSHNMKGMASGSNMKM
jgi:hypothetical protein